jgi:hypothetical protein
MTTVFVVRHGRTALNAGRALRGRVDVPLDEVGLAAARCRDDLAPGSGYLAGRDPQQRRGGHRQHHPGGGVGKADSGRHGRVQDPDDRR